MEFQNCLGCMEELVSYPCPKCGYTPAGSKLSYALRPGTVLNGKYLVGKVLGQGGFGITYIGWDLQLERKVAIKEYFPSGHVSRKADTGRVLWYTGEEAQNAMKDGQEMFLKEARKMSRVSQISQVVQVFSVFQENGTAYICMDFVEGQTLKDRLKKTGPLSWDQARSIFLPVMDAMIRVHEAGLIHRDISPDNLMLQKDGGVKILDLGAAKDLNLNSGKSSMQVAKSGFSPLEQYMQQGNSGPWTDVYAMAATMYYTLTGVLPPSAIDRMDRDELRWDLPGLQAVPAAVLEAMKHALALRAGDRTKTMADFSRELVQPVKKGRNQGKPKLIWAIPAVAATLVLAVVLVVTLGGKEKPGAEASPALTWEHRMEALIETSQVEKYTFQNGTLMEMYFDTQGQECLRIFVNEKGQDEFVYLCEYDAEGNLIRRDGIENQSLMRTTVWTRDSRGNASEIVTSDGSGSVKSKTLINYDSQGREISRKKLDGNGAVEFEAASVYDAAGWETYSGAYPDGRTFEYTYDADGKIHESVGKDAQGNQTYRSVYTYDEAGRTKEYVSLNPDGTVSYKVEYRYAGDRKTGEKSYSYYGDTEYITEYEIIYGPRDIEIGERNLDAEYGGVNEYVKSPDGAWMLRTYNTYVYDAKTTTSISYYNWDGDYLGYEDYSEDGKLKYKSERMVNEAGEEIGSSSVSYAEDGSYTVSQTDLNYNTLFSKIYNEAGKLMESTEYFYDENGERESSSSVIYEEDGSYTEEERDASYHLTVSRTYDALGSLVSTMENQYDAAGNWNGSVSTYYYYDGSYMVTEKNAKYEIVSQITYDANGNRIK